MTTALSLVLPVLVASYVADKIWEHKRHWYTVPAGWRLPKVEVACLASAVGSLVFVAGVLG